MCKYSIGTIIYLPNYDILGKIVEYQYGDYYVYVLKTSTYDNYWRKGCTRRISSINVNNTKATITGGMLEAIYGD